MKTWKEFGKLVLNKPKKEVSKAITIDHVAVFGYGDAKPNSSLFKEVVEVTNALARYGYIVVDGGGPGVMRAATIGAKKGGGFVVGVTFYPSSDDEYINFEGRDRLNKFDKEITTSSYVERTLTLMKEGQVYVVFNGGTGTISEFGMAWGLARLYFGHHKPLVLYGKFWKKIMKTFRENMLIRPQELKVFKIVDSPEEVLEAICEFEEEIERGEHKHLKTTKGDFSL